MFFKRKKSAEQAEQPVVDTEPTVQEPTTSGPFDIADAPEHDDYLDFGAILVKPVEGLGVRMDVEQSNNRVIAISLELLNSRIQLMAFSSSKSGELWPGIRTNIAKEISAQKGEIYERESEFGHELLAQVPQQLPDGRQGRVILRFVGFDGPRWCLRATIGGAALQDEETSNKVDEYLRSVIVNRGEKPMPPAELLPLQVPKNATASKPEQASEGGINPPERGPEITQIG
ncbi:DUF3710 domain-containing protein [Glutamicibacter sp. PS]|uniref:DUF3710 domain-containing protein n=1 Tax=Glutamicibacter TaxID=1742989 RepID=UPI00283B57C3|nr:DUF3710 domain-containing protein [Glutamicibacter sp. PS]MDR4532461.1 DUF3710 domain-containing protein [Glutamicibacter sp. PS]